MRVLLFSLEYPPVLGGGATYAQNLAKGLSDAGIEVLVLTSGNRNETQTHAGIPVVYRESLTGARTNTAIDAKMIDDVKSVILGHQPDIVHSFHTASILIIKTISETHPVRAIFSQLRTPELPSALIKDDGKGLLSELALKLPGYGQWVVPSYFYKSRLIRSGIAPTTVSFSYPSVDYVTFRPEISNIEIKNLTAKLKINEGDNVITIPCVDRPRKDVRFALAALQQLANDRLRVVITGVETPPPEYLQDFPNVIVVKHDPLTSHELAALFHMSRAVILSSTHEGLGLAAIEALACGTEVYLRNSPGLEEIALQFSWVKTFTTKTELASQLQLALKSAPVSKRTRTQRHNRSKAAFNASSWIEHHSKIYQETLKCYEFSAGGIVIRRQGSILQAKLVLVEGSHQNYVIPKGHLHHTETWEAAAAREIQEEAGIILNTSGTLIEERSYAHKLRGYTVRKYVRFYLYYLMPHSIEQGITPEEHEGIVRADWVSLADAIAKMKHPAEAELIKRIYAELNS